MTKRFNVGDEIQFKHSSIVKIITEVRDSGYSWKYPYGDVEYTTDEEIDKFLEDGWHYYVV